MLNNKKHDVLKLNSDFSSKRFLKLNIQLVKMIDLSLKKKKVILIKELILNNSNLKFHPHL